MTVDATTASRTVTAPEEYVAVRRDLLTEAVLHVEHQRFDTPGHHLGPKLREALTAAPTIAHGSATQPPVTDQRTLAALLRTVPELVHVGEVAGDVGRLVVTALLPHVTTDQWDELLHTAGTHHDLDNRVIEWPVYDPDLPAQTEHARTPPRR